MDGSLNATVPRWAKPLSLNTVDFPDFPRPDGDEGDEFARLDTETHVFERERSGIAVTERDAVNHDSTRSTPCAA